MLTLLLLAGDRILGTAAQNAPSPKELALEPKADRCHSIIAVTVDSWSAYYGGIPGIVWTRSTQPTVKLNKTAKKQKTSSCIAKLIA